ncbi:hypothetical protein SpCBS45565_g03372 [Spizellomyces sp. 'palustris']|nr:hypothetical protein SpCBS45565_g03372 [Spizellomyces sp. 'palustris']
MRGSIAPAADYNGVWVANSDEGLARDGRGKLGAGRSPADRVESTSYERSWKRGRTPSLLDGPFQHDEPIEGWTDFAQALSPDISSEASRMNPSENGVELTSGERGSLELPSLRTGSAGDRVRQEAIAAMGSSTRPLLSLDEIDQLGSVADLTRNDHVPLRRLSLANGEEIDTSSTTMHKVTPNDTLAGVAILYRVKLSELKKANRLWNDDDIKLREFLVIPRNSLGSATESAAPSFVSKIPITPPSKGPSPDASLSCSERKAFGKRSVSSPSLAPVAETTEDLLRQIDLDLASTLTSLGNQSWTAGKSSNAGVPYGFPSVLEGNNSGTASNGQSPNKVRRGRVGSLEDVLGLAYGRSRSDSGGSISNPFLAIENWNEWILNKLKYVSNERASPSREEYSPISTDGDESEYAPQSSFSSPRSSVSSWTARTSWALPSGIRRRTASATSEVPLGPRRELSPTSFADTPDLLDFGQEPRLEAVGMGEALNDFVSSEGIREVAASDQFSVETSPEISIDTLVPPRVQTDPLHLGFRPDDQDTPYTLLLNDSPSLYFAAMAEKTSSTRYQEQDTIETNDPLAASDSFIDFANMSDAGVSAVWEQSFEDGQILFEESLLPDEQGYEGRASVDDRLQPSLSTADVPNRDVSPGVPKIRIEERKSTDRTNGQSSECTKARSSSNENQTSRSSICASQSTPKTSSTGPAGQRTAQVSESPLSEKATNPPLLTFVSALASVRSTTSANSDIAHPVTPQSRGSMPSNQPDEATSPSIATSYFTAIGTRNVMDQMDKAALIGEPDGPLDFVVGPSSKTRNIHGEEAHDNDDCVTVDTRISAHSAYSLARRAKEITLKRARVNDVHQDMPSANAAVEERTFKRPREKDVLGSIKSEHRYGTGEGWETPSRIPRSSHTTFRPYSVSESSFDANRTEDGQFPAGLAGRFRNISPSPSELTDSSDVSRLSSNFRQWQKVPSFSKPNPKSKRVLSTDGGDDNASEISSVASRRGRNNRIPRNKSPENLKNLPQTVKLERRVHFDHDSDAHGSLLLDDKVVMAVTYKNGKIGAAYYSVMDSKLYLMEDMEEDISFEITRLLRYQVQPSVIVTNARADDAFLEVLSAQDGSLPPCEIEIRPSTDFVYQTAKNKLCSIQIPAAGQHLDDCTSNPHSEDYESFTRKRVEMFLFLESIVSLDSVEMVGCAGALLNYITKARLTGSLEADAEIELLSVEQFSLNQYMHVNADTLCSLQIFQNEAHPSMHCKKGKEGFSLFGIMDTTKTPMGRALLRQWFLRPSMSTDVIRERHTAVGYFLRPDIQFAMNQLRGSLKHVKNIPKILTKMRTHASIVEWQAILKFSYYALKIRSDLRELGADVKIPIVRKINEVFVVQELKEVGSYVNKAVDFDASVNEGRVVVKPHVDDELDELKRTYHGLDDLLSHVAHDISNTIPKEFSTSLNVIYFPQLGYLITIPLKEGMTEREDFVIEGLSFQFCTANAVYYKSDRMFELDESIGDIHSMIVDREIEIIQRLQETVLGYRATLIQVANVCAELDCILSLADAAKKYNYTRPEMTGENIFLVVKGRHPLQELCVDVFVANDTSMGDADDLPRMILLTGANFSGKSVYLKQIALITYMAHIGSFVPAERAVIRLTDKILTRIQTRESVSKMQSTFMIDLQQVSVALRSSTRRSLVLLDEFGKGTDTADGIGLLCGVLQDFAKRGEDCPHVIAATHFHEIFTYNLLTIPEPLLLECTMEIMETRGSEGLTFLYHVKLGRSQSSWGVHCQEASDALARGDPIRPMEMDADKAQYAASAEVARVFSELDPLKGNLDELWKVVDEALACFAI